MKTIRPYDDLLCCLEQSAGDQPDATHVTTLTLAAASGRIKRMTPRRAGPCWPRR